MKTCERIQNRQCQVSQFAVSTGSYSDYFKISHGWKYKAGMDRFTFWRTTLSLIPARSKISPKNGLPSFRLLMFFQVYYCCWFLFLCECSDCFVEYDRCLNYFLGPIIRFHRRIRINSSNTPRKLQKPWKNIEQRQQGNQSRGENLTGTSESVIHQKGAAIHACFRLYKYIW